jgi:endoglucanase
VDVLEAFELPDDKAEGHLIIGVHYYGTHGFTRQQVSWTETYSEWEQRRDGGPVELAIRLLKNNFIDKRIPVIIGEFGAQNKNNTPDRINYALHYIEMAKQHGIVCFWWDDGGGDLNAEDVRNYTLFSRYRNEWVFPEIAEALTETAR